MFKNNELCNLRVVDVTQNERTMDMNFKAKYIKNKNGFSLESVEQEVVFKLSSDGGVVEIGMVSDHSYTMTFELDKTHSSSIITPYGNLPINVTTQTIETHEDENNIYIFLKYILEIDGEEIDRELEINCFK